jgi:hypothetical protein
LDERQRFHAALWSRNFRLSLHTTITLVVGTILMVPWLLTETRSRLTGMAVDQGPRGERREDLRTSFESEQDALIVSSCRHTSASPYLVADDGGTFAEDVLKYSSLKGISRLGPFL